MDITWTLKDKKELLTKWGYKITDVRKFKSFNTKFPDVLQGYNSYIPITFATKSIPKLVHDISILSFKELSLKYSINHTFDREYKIKLKKILSYE